MVFKRISDSESVVAPSWMFGVSDRRVVQDHPVYIPHSSGALPDADLIRGSGQLVQRLNVCGM
jgi:hypothetical protein